MPVRPSPRDRPRCWLVTPSGQRGSGAAPGWWGPHGQAWSGQGPRSLASLTLAASAGTQVLDVTAVEALDSAGLALLVALAQRTPGARVEGAPQGLAELLAAYRLTPALAFDADH